MSTKKIIGKYNIILLFHSYINEEIINKNVEELVSKFGSIEEIKEEGRYDTRYKKQLIKVNLINVIAILNKDSIKSMKSIIMENKNICKFMILVYNNKIIENKISCINPIEMKKYMFESLRIMPKELTGFVSKHQRILAKNIKRSKTLGLLESAIK
ncbi:30S ribosomal protein S18 [bacterium AB1]|nr:30S ribosomal protein S18 [bacterium AB1]